jgi:hypothetical protein
MIKLAIMIIASPAKHCRAGSDISWLSFQATEKATKHNGVSDQIERRAGWPR